ncbi:MAG: nucleoside-diphosphate kinase [Sarcina sp.]
MQIEKSLVIIKPDAVERGLIGKILEVYENSGLKILKMKMEKANKKIAEEHYEEHKNKVFYNELIHYITRSPLVVLVLEGENAINKVRILNGNTNPENAQFGTIRKRFAINKTENSVHASDSIANANKEIALWFPSSKI